MRECFLNHRKYTRAEVASLFTVTPGPTIAVCDRDRQKTEEQSGPLGLTEQNVGKVLERATELTNPN